MSSKLFFLTAILPYIVLHLTAIVPTFLYVILTTEYVDKTQLTEADKLFISEERTWLLTAGGLYCKPILQLLFTIILDFPFHFWNRIFWFFQFVSFLLVLVVASALSVHAYHGDKINRSTSYYLFTVITLFLLPWTLICFCVYYRLNHGMPIIQISWIITFFFPFAELICMCRFIGQPLPYRAFNYRVHTVQNLLPNVR